VRATVRVALPLCLAVLAFALFAADRRLDARAEAPATFTPQIPYSETVARLGQGEVDLAGVEPPPVPVEGAFRRGDTIGGVLGSLGLEPEEVHVATLALAENLDFRNVRAGEPYAAYYAASDHRLTGLEIPLRDEGRVVLARRDGGWESGWEPFDKRLVPRFVRGTIDGSLIGAMLDAGAPALLAYRMADVLAWDVDFSRDLRTGDSFEVVYDELEIDGRPHGLGEIWGLTLDNGGRRLEAYRFEGEYYDEAGRPLQKMFLRSPLRYTFVTSHFSRSRLHPVLKTYRPHWGVDYRAKIGTPVLVTASGVVTFAGWGKGSGKMVKVRHPNGFVTAYLHLSKFASGVRPGARVRQGEVIAYSGNTGLSTAPHLDYRVQSNGRWIDPLSLDNVPAEPIADERLADFEVWRDRYRAALADGLPLDARPQEGEGDEVRVAAHGGDGDEATPTAATAGR
jgi:murein DD-endopeptidase MepM/ murein hydrolase activator NlpD